MSPRFRSYTVYRRLTPATLIVAGLALFGCTTPPPKPVEPPPVAAPAQPPPPPRPVPAPEPLRFNVDILISGDLPEYLEVAQQLARQLPGETRIHNLKGDPRTARLLQPAIAGSGGDQVVAIGLLAARTAQTVPGRQLVFCQVFNFSDYALIGPNSKGVSLIPSPDFQFGTWKRVQPGLQRVGLLIGPNQDPLIAEARKAAERVGIALEVRVVESDQAMLLGLRELSPRIEGLWLVPDNRILSRSALLQAMRYSLQNGITVLGFDDQLLQHGALLSITSDTTTIARQVAERLRAGKDKDQLPGAAVVSPAEGVVRVNPRVAERLGLSIPADLLSSDHGP